MNEFGRFCFNDAVRDSIGDIYIGMCTHACEIKKKLHVQTHIPHTFIQQNIINIVVIIHHLSLQSSSSSSLTAYARTHEQQHRMRSNAHAAATYRNEERAGKKRWHVDTIDVATHKKCNRSNEKKKHPKRKKEEEKRRKEENKNQLANMVINR